MMIHTCVCKAWHGTLATKLKCNVDVTNQFGICLYNMTVLMWCGQETLWACNIYTHTHTHTPANSSWTRSCPWWQDYAGKDRGQDLTQGMARSRPPAKILLLARILPKNFLLGPDPWIDITACMNCYHTKRVMLWKYRSCYEVLNVTS